MPLQVASKHNAWRAHAAVYREAHCQLGQAEHGAFAQENDPTNWPLNLLCASSNQKCTFLNELQAYQAHEITVSPESSPAAKSERRQDRQAGKLV